MKTLGLMLLFFSLSGFGAVRFSRILRRMRREEALFRLIGQIRTQIVCYRRPLREVYAEAGCVSPVFDRVLREKGLSEALSEGGEELSLPPEAKEILYPFAGMLGKSEAGEQVRLCEETEAALRPILASERAALPGKRRTCMALSLSAAATAVILFL